MAVEEKCLDFLASTRNANALVDILEFSESSDVSIVRSSIKAIRRACKHMLRSEKDAVIGKKIGKDTEESAVSSFERWLREKYHICIFRLFELTNHLNSTIPRRAFKALLGVVIKEGKVASADSFVFPVESFQFVVRSVVNGENDKTAGLISTLEEYLSYDDIRYHTLRELKNLIEIAVEKQTGVNPQFVSSCFNLLQSINMPTSADDLNQFLVGSPPGGGESASSSRKRRRLKAKILAQPVQDKVTVLQEHRRVFSGVWLAFLQLPLPNLLYKRVLISLHKVVMPHLLDPKALIDFLTDSYNVGGSVSLLALNGLFVLIHEHNLDYPDFFAKLYALLDESIFYVKYTTRFFRLLDLFLTSSHLPAYLVASFIKRLARLSLTAPSSGIILLIPFICNLIKRHPICRVLLHRKDAEAMENDPYMMSQSDPAKSNALKSSLWEIKTMKFHYLPQVSSLASLLEKLLDRGPEHDMEKYLDQSYEKLFCEASKGTTSKVAPFSHRPPKADILEFEI